MPMQINGLSASSSTENLLNSHTLRESCICAKEQKHTVYMLTKLTIMFSTLFTTQDIDQSVILT